MQSLRVSRSEIAAHRGPMAPPRDPAPSRLTYKVHRLWLTPFFRKLTQLGLPIILALSLFGWYLANPENRAAIVAQVTETRRAIETRPEFMVKVMAIEGASPVLADTVRKLLPLNFPISSFDLDLVAMQERIAGLDVVESVSILIRPGGVLEVKVAERAPVLVWRRDMTLELVDAMGHRVATLVDRSARADLPLIAGAGANIAVEEALEILDTVGPLNPRLRGLVRVGERRWDLVLKDGPRLLLPEIEPILALQQVLALDEAEQLLSRNLTHVDMRDPRRPTLRLNRDRVAELDPVSSLSEE